MLLPTRCVPIPAVITSRRLSGIRVPPPGSLRFKSLGDWLVERALEHDRPIVLFRLMCDHLKAERIVRPGVTVLERLVATARPQVLEHAVYGPAVRVQG